MSAIDNLDKNKDVKKVENRKKKPGKITSKDKSYFSKIRNAIKKQK